MLPSESHTTLPQPSPMPGMAAGCPDAQDLANLKFCLGSDRQLCLPACQMHAQATATLLLHRFISHLEKSQIDDEVFV